MAKQDTDVMIYEPDGTTDTFTISSNGVFWKTYDYTYRITSSSPQTKGFLIRSSRSISVMVSNYREDGHVSTALVPPRDEEALDHMIVSYSSRDENSCATYTTCSFYTVTAFEDDTLVQIYRMWHGYPRRLNSVVLNQHEVLANRTLHTPDSNYYDHTGYYVYSDKPVSVTAGNPCTNTGTTRSGSSLWSSMPVVENLGTRYISHTLNYKGFSGPTRVRVVAISNDTEVTVAGLVRPIDYAGGVSQYTVDSGENFAVECDKPCLVAQISVYNLDSEITDGSAVAMATLIPTDKFANDVIFVKPDVGNPEDGILDFLSIVYLTENPDDAPLLYDGTELSGWTVYSGEGFSSLEIEVIGNRNVVHSLTSGGPLFAALLHGQSTFGKGYAYMTGYGKLFCV